MFIRSGTLRRHRAGAWRYWIPVGVGILLLLLAPAFSWAQGADSLTLSWTAPGDDGNIGTSTLYDLRYSTAPLDEASWASATSVTGEPVPRVAGTRETIVVRGLTRGTTYWFAIKAQDDAGNWASISNVVRWDWSFDTSPPAAPTGVAAAIVGSSVRVTWSANGEPDLGGYRVHRATAVSGPWAPISGTLTATQFDDTAPPTGAGRAWYAVTALDVSDNESARSASSSVTFAPPAGGNPVAWGIETGFPNPSAIGSPVTIPVAVPAEGGGAVIEIVDSAGRTVRRMDLGGLAPGRQNVTWDGRNDAGRDVAPGAYTAWLLASGSRLHMRMVRVP